MLTCVMCHVQKSYVPCAKEFVQCDRYKFWAVNIVTLLTLSTWIFLSY